jgi:hypothetical protein
MVNLPAMFGCDELKTEGEKEEGNGSASFLTATWSSATGHGQRRDGGQRARLRYKVGVIQKTSIEGS